MAAVNHGWSLGINERGLLFRVRAKPTTAQRRHSGWLCCVVMLLCVFVSRVCVFFLFV